MSVNMLDAYDKNGEFSTQLAMETLFDAIKALRKQHDEDQMRIRVLRFAYAQEVERNAD